VVPPRFAKASVLAAAVVALVGCTAQPQSATSTPTTHATVISSTCVSDPAAVVARTAALPTTAMSTDLTATIDKAAQAGLAQAAAPGAIVTVQSPAGLFIKAYGVADPATGAPMTADMYQRVGSVTKTFTATLIMQLAADGELSLDDPVSKYIPGVTNGDITIRMLADMTSGISSYTLDDAWQKVYFSESYRVWSPDELMKIGLALKPQDFAPGTAFDYSNTNTILLGKIIEDVTGESYQDVLKERILTPLSMSQTVFPAGSADYPSPHPQGFTLQGGHGTPDDPANTTDWNPSWGWTAGELISTATDLLRFDRAEATGAGLLPAEQQIERLRSFREFNGAGNGGYGLGWGCQNGWVGHAGELPGYNTSMFYSTSGDVSVITMTNSDIPSGACEARTLTDNPTDLECSSPATRIFTSIAAALDIPFAPQKK
jgi:D-alanyl-D-alanine carboxypeptidase